MHDMHRLFALPLALLGLIGIGLFWRFRPDCRRPDDLAAAAARDNSADYVRGFRDGWKSIPGSGAPPAIPLYANVWFLLFGRTFYDAGYSRGRTAARKSH